MARALGIGWLVLLLAGTSPRGTGQGSHLHQVLHPVFAHPHLVQGQSIPPHVAAHDCGRTGFDDHLPSPALGAGAGTVSADAGLALSPPLPVGSLTPLIGDCHGLLLLELRPPRGAREAPPRPPPRFVA